MFKNTLILMLLGALLGIVVASYAVPPALSWYTAPGGLPEGAQIQALVEIPKVIRYSTSKLLHWQTVSAGIGAGIGLVAGLVLGAKGRKRKAVAATPPEGEPGRPRP